MEHTIQSKHGKVPQTPVRPVPVIERSLQDEYHAARLTALYNVWSHHNTTQLQWPVVMIGVFFAAVSGLAVSHLDDFSDVKKWGTSGTQAAGLLAILGALAAMVLLRTMGRARRIMGQIESAITAIEKDEMKLPEAALFRNLNHPKPGVSGPFLIRMYLTGVIEAGLLSLALLLIAGMNRWSLPTSVGIWGGVVVMEMLRARKDHRLATK